MPYTTGPTDLPSRIKPYARRCRRIPRGSRSNDIPHRSYKDTLLPPRGRVLQRVQIEGSHAGQQIHLVCPDEESALIPGEDLPEDVKRDDNGRGEVILEESGGGGSRTDGL